MNVKKHIVIINQNARTRKLKKLFLEMEETFQEKQFSYCFYTTEKEEDAITILTKQTQPCRFYICGGDGTLHQAVNALKHTEHEIVLLPCGTGNDFSRMLKDHKDIHAHFHKSLQREASLIDVLKVNDTICINAACFALDHDIANHVHDHSWHYTPRKLAYLVTVLRRIFVYRCAHLEIIVDNENKFSGNALFATCNNAKFYGGGFCMTPNANLQDGQMDFCIIREFPRWKILYKFPPLLMKQPQKMKECISFQCKKADIYSTQGVNIDGESYQEHILTIEVLPQALRLVNEIK